MMYGCWAAQPVMFTPELTGLATLSMYYGDPADSTLQLTLSVTA